MEEHPSSQYMMDNQAKKSIAVRRLMKDAKNMETDPPFLLSAAPTDDNLFIWKAVIMGPPDTVFEGGLFKLTMEFPDSYPIHPPMVRFTSKISHPNIYSDGKICLDILNEGWSPALDVTSLLASIQSMLIDPNLDSPANPEVAALYTENRKAYNRQVRRAVEWSLDDDTDCGYNSRASVIDEIDLDL